MTILALDASTHATGWAYYVDGQLQDYGCITAAYPNLIERIKKMVGGLYDLIQSHPANLIVLEEVRLDGANTKTYKALMYLQAAFNFLLHEQFPKVKIEYFYPSEWRKICQIKQGRGVQRDAQKIEDIAFVKNKFGITANDDICDAIGIGWAYFHKNDAPSSSEYAW